MASSERFGYEWARYSEMTPIYEEQLKAWISPIAPADFKDKNVLDAGCGMGRNSYWPLTWGAERITAFDLDPRSLESASRNLANFPNAKIVSGSIYDITWKDSFDIVMCIGVLHHLSKPEVALSKLYQALAPNGRLVLWVYSYEGNAWIVKIINPIRIHITSRLPVALVHFLSYFCSIPLWLFVKMFPHREGSYLKTLSKFSFWHIHSIVFDQLIPTVANYWTKSQVEELLKSSGLSNFKIYKPPHGTGWTIVANK